MVDQAVGPKCKRKRKLVPKVLAQSYDGEATTSDEENNLEGLNFCLDSDELIL